MTTTGFDPAGYKASQEREWTATAEGWREHYKVSELQWQQVSAGLLRRARIRPGHRVLDIATGIGEPALAAAAVAGPDGQVVGTDLSAAMIGIAAGRARGQGITNVTVQVADADTGLLPCRGFDAAVCRWGLMFFADLPAALTGIRRALVPGGWLAASVVGAPDRYPLVTTVVGAVCTALELPPHRRRRPASPVSSACLTRTCYAPLSATPGSPT